MASFKKLREMSKEHLSENEKVIASVFGQYECIVNNLVVIRQGILSATDIRVVFYRKKLIGYDFEVIPYEKISSILLGKNFMGHHISFYVSNNMLKMKWINDGEIKEFVDHVKSKLGASQTAGNTEKEIDIPEQIKKLADLKDSGIITEEEFNSKKDDLLSRM